MTTTIHAEAPTTSTQAPNKVLDTSYFRYVPHERLPEYEAIGWQATDALVNTPHGAFSVLCEWRGGGLPVEPQG